MVTATESTVPELTLRGRRIPVLLPRWGDPRLRLAVVLLTVQVLGQTALEFNLSIAQILVTIGVSAAIETSVTFWRRHLLAWPASAMLTGNSIALLLRTSGTEHGDWWSLNGIEYFVLAVVLSLLAKYVVRAHGRHIFNPSNVGLVWIFVVVGPFAVYPQWLYWGPPAAPVGLTAAVILGGALWILRPLRMLPMAVSFLATLALAIGALAAAGHSFFAIWHSGPVTGLFYWATIVLSPETLIFVFFMMSDPQTTPRSRRARVGFGIATALVATGLIAVQPTEFGVKLGLLSSLTVASVLVPLLDRRDRRDPARSAAAPAPGPPSPRRRVWHPATVAAAAIAVGAVAFTLSLAGNEQLLRMEQGGSGHGEPVNDQARGGEQRQRWAE
jgi:Na+-translocating ferredoxin:NAD+ oxidoreductase RnfD subunit